jgi:hypothetical protein
MDVGKCAGCVGISAPEGVYDDPRGEDYEKETLPRLRAHYQFVNELTLFADVDHHAKFSINIFGPSQPINFAHIANLFAPKDNRYQLGGRWTWNALGIKNDENKWNTAGHSSRIVHITEDQLALFAKLYDAEGTPSAGGPLALLCIAGIARSSR